MKLVLIRHGRTVGNLKGCFNGVTDDPLCSEGIEALNSYVEDNIYPTVDKVISSPMKRCIQTSGIIYPQFKPEVVRDLREINFGDFENKNHSQLESNPDYIKWISSNGTSDIPNGESLKSFTARCVNGFNQGVSIAEGLPSAAFVIHGGTMMALLTALTGENFYTTVPGNGLGFVVKWEDDRIKDIREL